MYLSELIYDLQEKGTNSLDTILYYDCDAVIFKAKREDKFESEYSIGMLKNQIEVEQNLFFSSIACKIYSMNYISKELEHLDNTKCSGFSSYCEDESTSLNHQSFKNLLTNAINGEPGFLCMNQMRMDKATSLYYDIKWHLSSNTVSPKRFMLPSLKTLPIGITENAYEECKKANYN